MDAGIESIGVAGIWDPIAVALAHEAGEGATLDLRNGGKMGPMSGDPLDLRVTVTKVMKDVYVAASGALNPDFTQVPYQRARRDIWPMVEQ